MLPAAYIIELIRDYVYIIVGEAHILPINNLHTEPQWAPPPIPIATASDTVPEFTIPATAVTYLNGFRQSLSVYQPLMGSSLNAEK